MLARNQVGRAIAFNGIASTAHHGVVGASASNQVGTVATHGDVAGTGACDLDAVTNGDVVGATGVGAVAADGNIAIAFHQIAIANRYAVCGSDIIARADNSIVGTIGNIAVANQ